MQTDKAVPGIMDESRITSIQFNYWASGPFEPHEIVAQMVAVYRSGRIKQQLFDGMSEDPKHTVEYPLDKQSADEFFTAIETDLKIHEWGEDYSAFVCDGWSWQCKIRFSDRTVKTIKGTVAAPPGGEMIARMVKKLVKFKYRPLIFG